MSDLELFHVEPVVVEPVEKVSADRRRTMRQRAAVEAGRHPLTGGKTRPDWGTCGECAHRVLLYTNGNRKWPKCELYGITHGAGSDCRAWWPACARFEPGDPISPDAARWDSAHADRADDD